MKYTLILLGLLVSVFANAKTHLVLEQGNKFSKNSLDIKLGDTIEFKNKDKGIDHNVYYYAKGAIVDLSTQKPGKSTKVHFKAPTHKLGKLKLKCAFHPGMEITVNVGKADSPSTTK